MRTGMVVLACVVSLALPGIAEESAEEVYPVEILLTTTSDWTDVRLTGATLVATSFEVLEGADARGLIVSALSTLSVGKSSYDASRVVVRIRAYIAHLPAGWVRFTITKGHIGETTLSLRGDDGYRRELATFTHRGVSSSSDPSNPRTFTLRAEEITEAVEPEALRLPSETTLGGQRVLAFYYPWYGTPDGPSGAWVHWNPHRAHRDSAHVPLAGYYDSKDPETIRRQIREAKSAGIDGFIASWWGAGTFEDQAFRVLLEVAEEEGFLITPYYEEADRPSEIVAEVATIVSRYGASPAFLHVGGLPVVFFYVRVTQRFTLEAWRGIFADLKERDCSVFAVADGLSSDFLTVFQGIHTYNPVSLPIGAVAEQYRGASLLARIQGALFAATVIPGYDEAYRSPTGLYRDRADGATYHAYWEIARASRPNWILITSFNEWHEGSEIEPSEEFGDSYLTQTADEAAAWRRGEVTADRDGDGVPDDEDLCPEFPGSHATDGC
ncbi:MAG: hypothetical protein JSW65_07325 [Candidatus Bipolaricaulota bacterium]|nr:MAG: hypothetical protein JSW65_07325 [Candidatus Bipolaricaulota bacterium]